MLQESYKNLSEKKAIEAFHATARLKGIRVRSFSLTKNGRYINIRQKS